MRGRKKGPLAGRALDLSARQRFVLLLAGFARAAFVVPECAQRARDGATFGRSESLLSPARLRADFFLS